MGTSKDILAKSDGTLLLIHTKHVAEIASQIASHLDLNVETAYKGGLLHDIGKAHPTFQARLQGNKYDRKWQQWGFRHELASLLMLPAFPKQLWPELVEMVIAHHKSLENDKLCVWCPKAKEAEPEDLYDYYVRDYEQWAPLAVEILREAEIQFQDFEKEQSKEAFLEAFTIADKLYNAKPFKWSVWRGVLMGADHMASALEEAARFEVPPMFGITPDFSKFDRKSPNYPLSLISTDDNRPHTLVIAPTGAGKTDFLMRRCRGRVFYTLPFQASIDAMYQRMNEMLPDAKRIHRLHASSQINLPGNNTDEDILLQRFMGADVKVLTPFQLADIALGMPGFEAQLIDVRGADVILDEIHTYQKVGQAITLGIIKGLLAAGCRVHLGTATIPTALYQPLLELLGGNKQVYEVELDKETLKTYDRHRIFKHENEEEIWPLVKQYICEGKKVLLVTNRVAQAQEWYEKVNEVWTEEDKNVLLLHSRFKRQDRSSREDKLKNVFEPMEGKACVCVSTQVVEVSLDISFDVLITQAAPLDALIQRMGRVNRRREKQKELADVHIINVPINKAKPYDSDVIARSYNVLPSEGNALNTTELQTMLDMVYPTVDFTSIEASLIWDNEGKFKLPALTHSNSNVLLCLLEIDTETAILQSDLGEYIDQQTSWDKRRLLEIPVPRNTIAFKGYCRAKGYGSEPYIVDLDPKAYEKYGLRFDAAETQIL